jgi:NitT/TauT family transport system ATP-binding protein
VARLAPSAVHDKSRAFAFSVGGSFAMLMLRGVNKVFGSLEDGAFRVKALDNVSLEVREGEFFSIIGPSGCGKSTLLRIIGGLISGFEGEVRIGSELVQGPHPWFAMVFQEESTFPWRTTLGNVEFGLEMRGVSAGRRRDKALEMIRLVGLSGFEQRYPSELSGGMRQRVAIARALVMEPKILLMDEPFGALDEQTRIILGEELLRIRDKLGQTILFVTHNINESVQLSDRVMVMTARPGQVKTVFKIDLPRPRDSTIIASDQFGRLVGQVWGTLREESLKGFEQMEKRA